jgi:hypothetical protein
MNTKSTFDGLNAIGKTHDILTVGTVGNYRFYSARPKQGGAIVHWVAVSTRAPGSDGKWLRGEPYRDLENALRAAADAERNERIRKAQLHTSCVPYPLEDEGGPD